MASAFFLVPLSVQTKDYGEAELATPEVLQNVNHQFVIVKEGGEEGIIQVETSEANLQDIEKNEHCQKLNESQLETLKASYPAPKIKQKYRLSTTGNDEPFVVDESGERVVDTWQTVRSGFYLIDVPVI